MPIQKKPHDLHSRKNRADFAAEADMVSVIAEKHLKDR